MHIYPTNRKKTFIRTFTYSIIIVCVAVIFIYGFSTVTKSNGDEQKEMLKRATEMALRSCYAIEGVYPKDVSYLETHYGLVVDSKYRVYLTSAEYDLMSNVPPSVNVVLSGSGDHNQED